ncbi:Hypp3690 [Branchiostoma lanceolatum]|uniref:Hypp3690 protein n=1 Tax=Branchiostoma lanceolatum TaxID=7740 RepID=A0A8K0EYC9_BRALA|nr:Hypp3690 [Branchiostoma lanceolatum]
MPSTKSIVYTTGLLCFLRFCKGQEINGTQTPDDISTEFETTLGWTENSTVWTTTGSITRTTTIPIDISMSSTSDLTTLPGTVMTPNGTGVNNTTDATTASGVYIAVYVSVPVAVTSLVFIAGVVLCVIKRKRYNEQNKEGTIEVENILYNVTSFSNDDNTPVVSKGPLDQTDEGIVDNELYGRTLGGPSGEGKEETSDQDHVYWNQDSVHANQDPVYTNTSTGLDSAFVHNDIYDSKLTDC